MTQGPTLHGATWPQAGGNFSPSQSAHYEIVKKIVFTGAFHVFWASTKLRVDSNVPYVVSPLDPNYTKLSPEGLKLGHVEHDLDLHVHPHGFNLGSGSIWAQLPPASTWPRLGSNKAPLGPKSGVGSWADTLKRASLRSC